MSQKEINPRRLTIRLSGKAVGRGWIAISDVVDVLNITQRIIRGIASQLLGRRAVGRRGRPPAALDTVTTLKVVRWEQEGAGLVLELQQPLQTDLFTEDIGLQSLQLLISGIQAVRQNGTALPPYFNQYILRQLVQLRRLQSRGIDRIVYQLGTLKQAIVDEVLHRHIERLLQGLPASTHSVEGQLLELNWQNNTCRIYIDDKNYVSCTFLPELREELKQALGCRIKASGTAEMVLTDLWPRKLDIQYLEILQEAEEMVIKKHKKKAAEEEDPILALSGTGKEIWQDVDADEYVRQLREGWE